MDMGLDHKIYIHILPKSQSTRKRHRQERQRHSQTLGITSKQVDLNINMAKNT